ncbi:FK506-binding protein 4 [Metarhizium anisopliae]
MSAVPGPVYGLEVPPGEILIPAAMDFPASFRITMAALDPTEEPEADEEGNNYQQPLDITVNHGEKVFFVVTGTHTVYLTGNYIMDDENDYDSEDDEEDYDFDPEELDYAMGEDASDDESDELDDVEDPRVTEVDSDEEEAPKLVKTKKGKNKRAAEEADGLDEMIAKAADSKKQQKKLKNNKGEAVAAEESKKDKKVQFAKNLEQGPTGSGKQSGKATTGVKVVQGVTVDDRTIGKGRTVKKGDTVAVRYIGKLANGQQFDVMEIANKKGKPFSFKVGKDEVIKGWDIGIAGMAIGGERRLTIPANLGYGSRGMPGIPANSQLTFDVKLLEIK